MAEDLPCAGRVPTLDDGMWVGALDPATGASAWRVRAVQYPVIDDTDDDKRGKGDKTIPPYANVSNITPNAPPRLIEGKLRWLGMLAIDPANPKDVIVHAEKRLVPEEHRRSK